MTGTSSIASVLLAFVVAMLSGPLLGTIATRWLSARGLSNLLIEVRGAFLPFLLAPLLHEATGWKCWVIVGVVTGGMQGISVARWIARGSGEWSPSLVGGIALGRSRRAIQSERGVARGAVIGTLAATTAQVILLEAILSALKLPGLVPSQSLGGSLEQGAGASLPIMITLGVTLVIASELASTWLLRRRVPARSAPPLADRPQSS